MSAWDPRTGIYRDLSGAAAFDKRLRRTHSCITAWGRHIITGSPTLARAAQMSTPEQLAEALEITFDLFDAGLDIMRQNLKRADPSAADDEIDRRLVRWLHERPGAEAGDCGPTRGVTVACEPAQNGGSPDRCGPSEG
jgi:Rv0078B-related antitoxin